MIYPVSTAGSHFKNLINLLITVSLSVQPPTVRDNIQQQLKKLQRLKQTGHD